MSRIPIEPGRAVRSTAGRDSGRRLIVLSMDDEYAYAADGDLRRAEAPKKKKLRHVKATAEYFPSIAEIVRVGKMPSNAEIRKCLQTDRQGRIEFGKE